MRQLSLKRFMLLLISVFCCSVLKPVAAQSPSFDAVFQSHGVVMLLIDPASGQIVDANPAAAKFYGWSRENLQSMRIQQINTLSDEQVAEERALAVQQGRNYFIFRHALASGAERTVEVRSHPFMFDGRRLLLSVIHDITPGRNLEQEMWHYQSRLEELVAIKTEEIGQRDRRIIFGLAGTLLVFCVLAILFWFVNRRRQKAEALVREGKALLAYRQALFSTLFEQGGLLAGVLDQQGRLLEVNQNALKLIGKHADAVLGADFVETPWWEDAEKPRLRQAIRDAANGISAAFEVTHPVVDGTLIHVLFHAAPVAMADAHYIAVIGVDITRLKQVEMALKAAKKEAEAANVAKSRFLATMSHEIRTPMNAILGMAQLLAEPKLKDEDRLDFSRIILDAGESLLHLVNDILDYSKAEAGKIHLESLAFQPGLVLEEVVTLFSALAQEKHLTLTAAWQGSDALYLGDPRRIRQILMNLVSNAIKFTERGTVHIAGLVQERDAQSAWLEFSVTDTGVGLSPEQQQVLFKPFSQVDSSMTRQFAGAGLGLSIVKQLAELMGGQVGVESQPGQGSRFYVRVRVALLDAVQGDVVEAGSMADAEVFDEAGLLQRMAGDRALVQVLIHSAIDDFPAYLSEVDQAFKQADWAAAVRPIHTLKGLALQLGGVALGHLLVQLDRQLKAGQPLAQENLRQLHDHSARLLLALRSWTALSA